MRTPPLSRILVSTLVASSWLAFAAVAHAHFNLLAPPPADTSTNGGKGAPPCGPTAASNVVTKVQGGHPLMLSISETVMHPGHYRVALSVNSRSELPADPAVVLQGQQSVSATIQNPPVFPVLADGMFVHTTGNAPLAFMGTVMLPNITCARCTLQVIEFMAMHGPNVGGGYYYHHCADLEITADPALPGAGADAGAPATDAQPADAGISDAGMGAPATGGRAGGSGGGTGTGGADVPGTGSGGQGTGGASAPVPATGGNSVVPSTTGGASGTGGASARTGGASALDAGTSKPPAADSSSGCSIAGSGSGTDAMVVGYPAAFAVLAAVLLALWIGRRRRRV